MFDAVEDEHPTVGEVGNAGDRGDTTIEHLARLVVEELPGPAQASAQSTAGQDGFLLISDREGVRIGPVRFVQAQGVEFVLQRLQVAGLVQDVVVHQAAGGGGVVKGPQGHAWRW